MYASTYAIDEKRFAMILRLHTSAFDHATTMTLLKELMRLVAVRIDSDDGGEAKGGNKVNLVIEGGDKVNLVVALHK
jgi:hypothetical protein